MDKSGVVADSAETTFSTVIFEGIRHTYPPDTVIICNYILTAGFQPNPRDWVGIFKVGWSTVKDYHTFVWAEPSLDVVREEPIRKQAMFREYYLPKDDSEFYQFCYVDIGGKVRGASTPFCFKTTAELSVDCSLDGDLVVITTQDEVEQNTHEREELLRELCWTREEAETRRHALEEKRQVIERLKENYKQVEQEQSKCAKELSQTKEQNESFKRALMEQKQEIDGLKKELLIQKEKHLVLEQTGATAQEKLRANMPSVDELSRQQERSLIVKRMSKQQALAQIQEKYNQAVKKINQLKVEREDLKRTVRCQMEEIVQLNPKVNESDQELLQLRDHFQILKVDLQSSENEKDRLNAELRRLMHSQDNLSKENTELRRSLSRKEELQNIPDDELKVQHQTVLFQLQEARAQLAKERQSYNTVKERADDTEGELQDLKKHLNTVSTMCEQTKHKGGKLELQLLEANEIIAANGGKCQELEYSLEEKEKIIRIVKQEKEELASENLSLKRDIEGLRRQFTDRQVAPPSNSLPVQPPSPRTPQPTSISSHGPGSVPNMEEETLTCQHCHESFPGITQDELVLHEQSHRVCPFCNNICDDMEQAVFEDHVYRNCPMAI